MPSIKLTLVSQKASNASLEGRKNNPVSHYSTFSWFYVQAILMLKPTHSKVYPQPQSQCHSQACSAKTEQSNCAGHSPAGATGDQPRTWIVAAPSEVSMRSYYNHLLSKHQSNENNKTSVARGKRCIPGTGTASFCLCLFLLQIVIEHLSFPAHVSLVF